MSDLGEALSSAWARFADASAVEQVGQVLSYRRLLDSAHQLASALRQRGLSPDESVLVLVGNEARDFCALLGVWLAGGIVVPVHRGAPAAVREATRAATGARFLAGADNASLRHVAGDAPPHRTLLTGVALIVFTSGSTGRPKGVVLGHRAVLGKLEAIDSLLHFSAATRSLLVLKTTFIFGLWVSLLTLLRGGRALSLTRFDALETLRTASAPPMPPSSPPCCGLTARSARVSRPSAASGEF